MTFVRPATYRAVFRREGWMPQVRPLPLASGETARLDLQWDEGHTLEVSVVDSGLATPVQGAAVHGYEAVESRDSRQFYAAIADDDPRFFAASATTDAHGLATLRGLRRTSYDLVVVSGAHAPQKSVARLDRAAAPNARVELTRGSTLTGRVRGVDGEPAVGARVLISFAERWPGRIDDFAIAEPRSITDARGEFRFDRLRQGTYYAIAVAEDGPAGFPTEDGNLRSVQVGRDTTSALHFELDLRAPVARVYGTVRDGTGRPVAGAEVVLDANDLRPRDASAFAIGAPRHRATTGQDGRYEFQNVRRSWCPIGGTLEASGHEDVEFELDTRDVSGELEHDLEILQMSTAIIGRVRDQNGAACAEVAVLAASDSTPQRLRSARTNAAGEYRIEMPDDDAAYEVWITNTTELNAYSLPDGHFGVVAGARADFVLEAPRVIPGVVVDDEGRPIPDCDVMLLDVADAVARALSPIGDSRRWRAEMDHDAAPGRFRLIVAPGEDVRRLQLWVRSPTRGRRIVSLASIDPDTPELRIRYGSTLVVQSLVDARGVPIDVAEPGADPDRRVTSTPELARTLPDGSSELLAYGVLPRGFVLHLTDPEGVHSLTRMRVFGIMPDEERESLHAVDLHVVSASGAPVDGKFMIHDDAGPMLDLSQGIALGADAKLRLRLTTGAYTVLYMRDPQNESTEPPSIRIELPSQVATMEFRVP